MRSIAPGCVKVVICVDAEGPNALGANVSWDRVEGTVQRVTAPQQRMAWCDSKGRPPSIGWFIVDWIGETENLRRMQVGFHAILDRYSPWIANARMHGFADDIFWHYHHSLNGRIDSYNRDWTENTVYETILSRRLLERGMWPIAYRAGNTWEDTACSRWLERWFPFDMSSRGPYRNVHYDWRNAPTGWVGYHPHPDDVQRPGSQRRLMARSLDIEKGQFAVPEVEQAFLTAASGRGSYVSFYLHDSGDMVGHISHGLDTIRRVAKGYPGVRWEHSDVVDLFRTLSGQAATTRFPELSAELDDHLLTIRTTRPIFGEPWVAVRHGNEFIRIDAEPQSHTEWTASVRNADALAVAVTDQSGLATVRRIK